MSGPVIIVDNDLEDYGFMLEAFQSLDAENPLRHFTRAQDAYNYLLESNEKPFLIFSEVQLIGMDGIALRRAILKSEYLRRKSIPFIFYTANYDRPMLLEAYDLQVQGYFIKQYSIPATAHVLKRVIDYWQECYHPNMEPR